MLLSKVTLITSWSHQVDPLQLLDASMLGLENFYGIIDNFHTKTKTKSPENKNQRKLFLKLTIQDTSRNSESDRSSVTLYILAHFTRRPTYNFTEIPSSRFVSSPSRNVSNTQFESLCYCIMYYRGNMLRVFLIIILV